MFLSSRFAWVGLILAFLTRPLLFGQDTATITTFDEPNAGTGSGQGTVANAINQAGTVTGYYIDSTNMGHGFIRASDGTFTSFDANGALVTEPLAINVRGATTGVWAGASGVTSGFYRSAAGTVTEFSVKVGGIPQPTYALSINQGNAIAGEWVDSQGVYHGFIRSPGGSITSIDDPAATDGTRVVAINNAGTITGSFSGPPNADVGQAFFRTADGTFTNFTVSGGTGAGTAINSAGTIAGGYYTGTSSVAGGFVRATDGTITTFGEKGEISPYSINDSGAIAGDVAVSFEGFVRNPSGKITNFRVPGATEGMSAQSINAKGVITGWYTDSNGVFHGFLRTP